MKKGFPQPPVISKEVVMPTAKKKAPAQKKAANKK
jgi:hypothetical protein